MNRYFQVNPEAYERTRIDLDKSISSNSWSTIYEPLLTAVKNKNGKALMSVRQEHSILEPFSSAISLLISSQEAIEISEQEYYLEIQPIMRNS